MKFYADTVGMPVPSEGSVAGSAFTSGDSTYDPRRLVDGQIGSSTSFNAGSVLITSNGNTFITSAGKIFETADTSSDAAVRFTFSSAATIDFVAFYVTQVTGTPTATIYASNTSTYSSIDSFSFTSTGWQIREMSEASYTNYVIQFSGSFTLDISEMIIGQKFEPTNNPEMTRVYGTDDNIVVYEGYDGTEYALKRGNSAITRVFNWSAVGTSDLTNFERIRDNSHHKKFIYNDDSINYHVYLDQIAITEVANGLSSVNMGFSE